MKKIIQKVKRTKFYGKVIEFIINRFSKIKVEWIQQYGSECDWVVGTSYVSIWDGGAQQYDKFASDEEEKTFNTLLKFYW